MNAQVGSRAGEVDPFPCLGGRWKEGTRVVFEGRVEEVDS